jgi:fatty-acyl-CoA synthase
MLGDVRDRCPELREAIVLDDDWDALLAEASSEDELVAREGGLQFDDPINIQYTSGTTGFPKGATLSHHNILNNGHFIAEILRYTEADRVCVPVPFYHCFGMVIGNLACMTRGACVVVPGEGFDPLAVLETVAGERCTSLYGVPTMFVAELEHPRFSEFDLSTLRTGVMAGSPCPIETMKKVRTLMHMEEVTICCGMTETSPVSTQTTADDPVEKRVTTVGHVHPHLELKVVDPETGGIVPRGVPGEQCTRGYSVMIGYWGDEEAYLSIVGRIKDMIIRGGENIYPREIEEFLLTLPDVVEAYVIGVPSERYGEEVMAWVKLRDRSSADGDSLAAACRGAIASFKIPRYWKLVDEFPMTVTGKIQKFKMREASIEELGLAEAAAIKTA